MALISPQSVRWRVIGGPFAGRQGSIPFNEGNGENHEFVGVSFFDRKEDEPTVQFVHRGHLAPLHTPGQEYRGPRNDKNLRFFSDRWLSERRCFAFPFGLRSNDRLATGNEIFNALRVGYNGAALVMLDEWLGWVELQPRDLPVALEGHARSGLPADLEEGEVLVTGCCVLSKPESLETGWVILRVSDIDGGDDITWNVPACIPLAKWV